MKDSEQAIEKVLAALRDTDAPAGMERRILDATRNHASTQYGWGWLRLRPIWPIALTSRVVAKPVGWGFALVGIVALILASPAIHRHERVPTQSKRNVAAIETVPPPPSVAESAQPSVSVSSVRPARKLKARRVGLIRADESVAMREMRAPSRPEPPLPLTEQEKLLLRFAQMRNPEELAALDPVNWAARDAEERAEFEKFFVHQRAGDNE